MNENQRRLFLKTITSIPILGGAVLAVSAVFRYLQAHRHGRR